MRKQFLSLHSGNKAGKKAFIFSLDIIVAVIIVSFVLIVATFYVTKAGGEPVSRLQTTRIGSDVLAMLDHNKTLETLSSGNLEIELNRVLPINYHMRIKVDCIGGEQVIAETTDVFPKDRFIGAGKRVFVTNTSKYCIADYSIWLK